MDIYNVKWDVGAHTEFSGTLYNSIKSSINNGMYATQIFLGNPKSFKRAVIKNSDIIESKKLTEEWPIHVFSHFPYIANLAGSKHILAWSGSDEQDRKTKKVISSLEYELGILGNFEKNGVVIHPGNHTDRELGISTIAKSINKISFPENSKLILENAAGQGTSLATTLEELKSIIDLIDEKDRIGVCIDTCHLFAVGDYDFSTISEVQRFFSDFDSIIGSEYLSLIHLNDSKTKLGSRKDRHEMLGLGYIWSYSFCSLKYLLEECKQRGVPLILETSMIDMLTLSSIN